MKPPTGYCKLPAIKRCLMWSIVSMDRTLTILLGEDNIDDVELMKIAFKRADLSNPVQVCRDGEEVIAYLEGKGRYADREHHPFPRLLILDLKMPRLTGLGVLRWVKEHPACCVIPTVILSTSMRKGDVQEAYALGANAYLSKPFDTGELKASLHDLFQFWSRCELPDLPVHT